MTIGTRSMFQLFEHWLASEAVPICSYSSPHGHLAIASLDQRGHNNWNCFVWSPECPRTQNLNMHTMPIYASSDYSNSYQFFLCSFCSVTVSLRPTGFLWTTMLCMARRSSDYPEARSKWLAICRATPSPDLGRTLVQLFIALVGLRWPLLASHPERSREMLSSASIYTFGMTSQFLLVETWKIWKQMVCIMVYRCIIQIAMGQIKS